MATRRGTVNYSGSYFLWAFFVVWLGAKLVVAYAQAFHRGEGFWGGDHKLQPSMHTPGGPYYPSD